jgi:hypothetical protein
MPRFQPGEGPAAHASFATGRSNNLAFIFKLN